MNTDYDVIIVGAGVVGLSQALALAKAGFHVAVIDAMSAPDFSHLSDIDVRVFALNRYTENCLRSWGIVDKFLPGRFPDYDDVNLALASNITNLHFAAKYDAEPNLGHIVEQKIWRKAALDIAFSNDKIDFYWEHVFDALEFDGQKNRVSMQVKNKAKLVSITAALVIGADGVHSKVREALNITVDSYPCGQTAFICNIKTTLAHHHKAYQFFTSQGIVAFLPLANQHHYSIVWSAPDALLHNDQFAENNIATALYEVANNWGELQLISKVHAFPLIQRQAKSYYQNASVLIGDAAHTIHPLAGQGANLGVADVALLTQCLLRSKEKARSLNDPVALGQYARQRRTAAWQMMGLMSSIQQLGSMPTYVNPVLNLGTRLLDRLTPAKALLSRFALYGFTQ